MNEIAILEDVLERALQNPNEEVTLVGETNILKTPMRTYDLLFHVVGGFNFEKLNEDSLLVVPIVPFTYPTDEFEGLMRMHNLYKNNHELSTFAMRDEGSLRFYRRLISRYDLIGSKFGVIPAYTSIGEQEFRHKIKDSEKRWSALLKLRRRIDKACLVQVV